MMSNKSRGKNFTDKENRQLCLSWLAVSEDPIRGTDQNCSTFWTNIMEHAKIQVPSFEARTPEGLRQRWGIISRSVSKFTGCFKSIVQLNESGTNDEDKLEKARKVYQQDLNEEFKFLDCWEILRKSPKFSPGNDSVSTPKSSLIDSSPNQSRPIGRNSAKLHSKSLELETRRVLALEKIAAASEGKVQLFKEYTDAIRQENLIKLASINTTDLDETSARLIRIQKEKVLKSMLENVEQDIIENSNNNNYLEVLQSTDDFEIDEFCGISPMHEEWIQEEI